MSGAIRRSGTRRLPGMLATGGLVLLAVVFFFPMVWMVVSSFKSNSEIFRAPFALPDRDRLRPLGRGLGGGPPRQLCAEQRDRHRRVRGDHPDLRLGRGLRIQPLPVPRSGLPDGRVRARAVVAAAVLLHRPVAAVHPARDHRHAPRAHHPVRGDGHVARGLSPEGVHRRLAATSCSKRPASTAQATHGCSGR